MPVSAQNDDALLGAEIEHLLRLGEPTDHRARN
jgi:hypothetical protein